MRKMHTSFKNRFKSRGIIFAKEFITYLKKHDEIRVHEPHGLMTKEEIIEISESALRTYETDLGLAKEMS